MTQYKLPFRPMAGSSQVPQVTLPPISTLPFPDKCVLLLPLPRSIHHYKQEISYWQAMYRKVDGQLSDAIDVLYQLQGTKVYILPFRKNRSRSD